MYIITGNQGKLLEYQHFFPQIKSLNLDLSEIQELDPILIQNYKIQQAFKHLPNDFLIDDVSFYLDCLPGLPGPFIKWFNQTIEPLGLYDLAVKYQNFGATAICLISYVDKNSNIKHFAGEVSGKIVQPRGESGFGFDAIFQPDKGEKTYAEMDKTEKNQLSHRGVALAKLAVFLETGLAK